MLLGGYSGRKWPLWWVAKRGATRPVSDDRTQNNALAGHGREDFRRAPRRRGRALEEAIYRAALEELAEYSFVGLSIERIAERAGTGKSAIYRRWTTKLDLVVDTMAHAFPPPGPAESTGDLRADLLLFHRRMAEALGGTVGAALRANVGQHRQHPELAAALQKQILAPRHRLLGELLAAGVRRGKSGLAPSRPSASRRALPCSGRPSSNLASSRPRRPSAASSTTSSSRCSARTRLDVGAAR